MRLVNNIVRPVTFVVLFGFLSINAFSQTNSFYVYFKQNDKRVNIKKEKVELKKESFEIFLEYTEPVDVLINSASKGSTYNQAMNGKLLYYMSGFTEEENIESFFLNDKTINLTEDKPTVWPKNETHGEKGLKTPDGRAVCSRNIEKLYSIDDQRIYKVEDFKKDLYLVFIYVEKDKDGERMEIQRELVKIKWVESYEEETKSYQRKKKVEGKSKIRIAEQNLKNKQKSKKKEEKALKKLDKKKKKKEEKEKKKAEKMKKKKEKKTKDEKKE